MRAPAISWPSVIIPSLMALPLAWLGGSIADAADRAASSVNFVDRDALAAAGWSGSAGNPLRSGQTAQDDAATRGNGEVVPASYNSNSQPSRGVSLRPYTPPTGIFSAAGSGKNATAAKPRSTSPPSTPATERTKGLIPQFMSFADNRGLLPAGATGSPPRAGSVQQAAAAIPTHSPAHAAAPSRSPSRSTAAGQAAYRTAASAQSFRHAGMSGNETNSARQPNPPIATTRPAATRTTRPPAASAKPDNTANSVAASSSAAQALIRAYKLAENAHTEDDYSRIVDACQRIPLSQASAQETTFGRELASWAFNRRGQLHAKAGRTQPALSDFDDAVRLDPQRWRAIHNRGVLMAQSGQLEQAFDDFHRTIQLNPRFAKAHSNRAALYVLAGELEPALRDYQQAAKLDPGLAIAHRGCGRMCHMLGRMNEALQHFDEAIELAPLDATALVSRGDLLTDLGHYPDAAADYERALEVNANSAEACRSSAWLLATCPDKAVRNPELALRRAQMAARLERQTDSVTYDTLAAAQASAGDFRQAVESIRQAIELAPASERSVYEDRLRMYRRSTPMVIEPMSAVQQAGYER